MLGMIGALALIWIGFNIYTQVQTGEGLFLTPRNLWNLSGPDLLDRDHGDRHGAGHRDAPHRPFGRLDHRLRRRRSSASRRSISCRPISASTIRRSGSSRSFSRWRSARRSAPFTARSSPISAFPPSSSPSAAQLFWRGAAWWVTTGQTIAPLDDRFALMGGGPHGSIGAMWSWALAAARLRRHRLRPLRRPPEAGALPLPAAADVGGISDRRRRLPASSLGATAIVNAYPWPERVAARYARRPHTFPCRRAACSFRPATPFRC